MKTGTKTDNGDVLTLRPIGAGGVDLTTDPTQLLPPVLSKSENLNYNRSTCERRPGAIKLTQVVDPTTAGKSRTYAATTKYATFTPPLIPVGGLAFYRHFTATRPSGGNTAQVLGSVPTGQTFHIIGITLSDAGVIVVVWRDSAGADHTVTCTAVADGLVVHLFGIYDAVAGTFTVYVNGASSGTPLTGLSATLKPDQTTAVVWTFGVHKVTGSAVTANTNFDGASDGFTLFTLRGQRPASGTTTLVESLRRHSARAWPLPQADMVLAHYDEDEPSGTVMYDRSNNKNHGTYVGTPTVSDPIALLSAPTNWIGSIDVPVYGKSNVIGVFGRLFYENTGAAAV